MRFAILLLGFAWVVVQPLFAQAWVPPKGQGALSFTYYYLYADKHLYAVAPKVRPMGGSIVGHSLVVDFEYGLGERLTLDLGVPYVTAKYTGPAHPGHDFRIDDTNFHSTLQDSSIGVRYQALRGPVVLTPYVRAIVPTHDYPALGHAAFGRNLNELHLGAFFGWNAEPISPRLYIQGRYAYAVVERLHGIFLDRSNADVEGGYFLTESLFVRGSASFQRSHGGLDFSNLGIHAEHWDIHDRILIEHYIRATVGTAYSLTDSYDVYVNFSRTLAGRGAHLSNILSIGVSWNFGRPRWIHH